LIGKKIKLVSKKAVRAHYMKMGMLKLKILMLQRQKIGPQGGHQRQGNSLHRLLPHDYKQGIAHIGFHGCLGPADSVACLYLDGLSHA
jgi:hypothetical protein